MEDLDCWAKKNFIMLKWKAFFEEEMNCFEIIILMKM